MSPDNSISAASVRIEIEGEESGWGVIATRRSRSFGGSGRRKSRAPKADPPRRWLASLASRSRPTTWRKEYAGLLVDQAKRLKELEKENARLKKPRAEQVLDKAIPKEAAAGDF